MNGIDNISNNLEFFCKTHFQDKNNEKYSLKKADSEKLGGVWNLVSYQTYCKNCSFQKSSKVEPKI